LNSDAMDRGRMFEATMVLLLLALCALLFVAMTAGSAPAASEQWKISSISPTAYTYAGDDGRLFIFDGNDVYAISDGTLLWKYSVPAEWTVINEFYDVGEYPFVRQFYRGPVFCSDDDVLYLYARPNDRLNGMWSPDGIRRAWGDAWNESMSAEKLMAIADGKLLWEQQLPKGTHEYNSFWSTGFDDVSIYADGAMLYVYHSGNLSVMGTDGTRLWSIGGLSCPPAVNESGYVYGVTATDTVIDKKYELPYPGYTAPSGIVEAYYPDGSLFWQLDLGEPARRPVIYPGFGREHQTLPLYDNGVLYVPLSDGMAALAGNGTALWTCKINSSLTMYEKMPFDAEGNVYLADDNRNYVTVYPPADIDRVFLDYNPPADRKIYAVGADGSYTSVNESYKGLLPIAALNGVAYYVTSAQYDPDRPSLDRLLGWRIEATSLKTGDVLWSRYLEPGKASQTMVNESNVRWIFYDDTTQAKSRAYIDWHPTAWRDQSLQLRVCGDATQIEALPRGNTVYFSYYSLNYEYPTNYETMGPIWLQRYPGDLEMIDVTGRPYFAIINRSRCAYASGILALGNDGRLLWQTPTGSCVTGMAANNSTIFYGTRNGGLAAMNSGIAAGFAILAAVYVFLRFFLVGTVARARSRLEQNKNRNDVLRLIKERPGSTMREISRELDMNIGTMRYHLLILAINHKIKEHRDGKYVRYFAGSSTYTSEELEIISLLRREPVRRLMAAIRGKPGISNGELAEALGLSEAAISNYMRELSGRGFVDKEPTKDGHVAYFIKRERADKIVSSLDQS
jgi:predicted transcriptional regulator